MLKLILTCAAIFTTFGVSTSKAVAASVTKNAYNSPTDKTKSNKSKAKPTKSPKKNSKFNPSNYLKKKQAHEHINSQSSGLDKNVGSSINIGEQGVICKPKQKPIEPCSGSNCQPRQVEIETQGSENSIALIDDNNRLTKEVMKSIRENCAPIEETEPYFKPIFEVGITEPAIDSPEKRSVVPKVGIHAIF